MRLPISTTGRSGLVVAMLVLSGAIAVNTVAFALLSAVLLGDPGYRNADSILTPIVAISGGQDASLLSATEYVRWRDENAAFSGVGAFTATSATVAGEGAPVRVAAVEASPSVLRMLSVSPLLGALFEPMDEVGARGCVAIASHRLMRRLAPGSDRRVDLPLELDGRPCTLIGVMPDTFAFPTPATELWLPLDPRIVKARDSDGHARVSIRWFSAMGLLKPGVTVDGARSELKRILGPRARDVRLVTLSESAKAPVRGALILAQVVAAAILIIAGTNLAALLLAGGLRRQKELAIKASLGASRSRLVGEIAAEVGTMGLAAGALGAIFATWALTAAQVRWAAAIPQIGLAHASVRAFVFAILAGVIGALAAGLVPAVRAMRVDVTDLLKAEGGGLLGNASGSTAKRIWGTVIGVQIAITTAALVGTMAFAWSIHLTHRSRGFDPRNVFTIDLRIPVDRYPSIQGRADLIDRLMAAVGGVHDSRAAAVASSLPVGVETSHFRLAAPDAIGGEIVYQGDRVTRYAFVSADYFQLLRIPLVKGRTFSSADRSGTAPVMMISRSVETRDFKSAAQPGQRMERFLGRDWEIVGVVDDVFPPDETASPLPMVYLPYPQIVDLPGSAGRLQSISILLASAQPRRSAAAALSAISRADSWIIPTTVGLLSDRMEATYGQLNLEGTLVTVISGITLVLAAAGLMALVIQNVARQRRELGIRMALGASRIDVIRVAGGHAAVLVIIGALAGALAGTVAVTAMRAVVYGLAPPPLFVVVGALCLVSVSCMASCVVPVRRALQTNPVESLRSL
jgi:predicted permease